MNPPSNESVARALIAQIEGMGPRLFENLMDECSSVSSLFDASDSMNFSDVKGIGDTLHDRLQSSLEEWDLRKAREKLVEKEIGVISQADEEYPDLLSEIYEPPIVLFYRGNLNCVSSLSVAVVGTRKASERGKEFARNLAKGLASHDVSVVSGLAAGIDRAAHEGALEGEGPTVSVLGNGVDRYYPSRNKQIQRRIAEDGLVVSEYPPGVDPKGEHFPERNRIISGLSRAVVVVQAAARSGSLITTDRALEQGRDVMAVPGNVDNSLHEGCHRLIKQGAALVESPEDVLDQLQLGGRFESAQEDISLSEFERELLSHIHDRPIHVDELVNQTGKDLGTCAETLLSLENKGLLHGLPGQRYQRSQNAMHYEINENH